MCPSVPRTALSGMNFIFTPSLFRLSRVSYCFRPSRVKVVQVSSD
jgi:hypothetical protein